MLIENVELFKTWLSKSLAPICDADPQALAKYVIALVKKDKPESFLRETCTDQLDVFLQDKTRDFIENLFETLKKKSYLPDNVCNEGAVNGQPVHVKTEDTANNVPSTTVSTSQNISAENNTLLGVGPSNIPSTAPVKLEVDTNAAKPEKVSDNFDNQPGRRRSKSPYRERDDKYKRRYDDKRRSDRDRRDDRRAPGRYNRNEIDYRRGRRSPPRRSSRSRSRSRDRLKRSPKRRSRSISPRKARSRTRSRSKSGPRSPYKGKGKSPDSRGSTPTQDHGDGRDYHNVGGTSVISSIVSVPPPYVDNYRPRLRCRDFDEKGFCMRGDLCLYDHGIDPVIVDDVSLGAVMPFPGGGPPRGPIPRPLGPLPLGMRMPMRPGPPLPPPMHRPPRPPPPPGTLDNFMPGNRPPPPPGIMPPLDRGENFNSPRKGEQYKPEPYNPEAPDLGNNYYNQDFPIQPPVSYKPRSSLVTVPTIPEDVTASESDLNGIPKRTIVMGHKRPYAGRGGGPAAKRSGHIYNRLGPKRDDPKYENTTLEIAKIPPEMNNITKLNEHFSKFGTLVNLQIKHGGDPGAALITFSTNAEASAAYHSSEPVLNNRFVRVFWHKKASPIAAEKENPTEEKPSLKERLGKAPQPEIPPAHKLSINKVKKPVVNKVVLTSSGGITKTVFNQTVSKPNADTTSKIAVQKALVSEKKKLLQKEAAKKKTLIEAKKRALMVEQIEQQKVLLAKIDGNKGMSVTDKANIMKTISTLANSISKLQAELKASANKVKPAPKLKQLRQPQATSTPKLVSKQQAQKEILDTELDIIAKQNEGGDTSALRKRVAELKREATALGLLGHGTGRGHGHRYTPKPTVGRAAHGINAIDHRPKQLLVAGFNQDEKEEVLQHFMSYGEVVNTVHDDTVPSIILEFKTRHGAEQAVIGGQHFGTKSLVMSWYQPQQTEPSNSAKDSQIIEPAAAAPAVENTDNLELNDIEPELALGSGDEEVADEDLDEEVLLGLEDEEDEEDDSADRSWKR